MNKKKQKIQDTLLCINTLFDKNKCTFEKEFNNKVIDKYSLLYDLESFSTIVQLSIEVLLNNNAYQEELNDILNKIPILFRSTMGVSTIFYNEPFKDMELDLENLQLFIRDNIPNISALVEYMNTYFNKEYE